MSFAYPTILQGLVAFSEHGLVIRWWSLGSVWWEKLSRNLVPAQCTKVIFVPPGEGFSPHTSRSSIMGSVLGHDSEANSPVIFFPVVAFLSTTIGPRPLLFIKFKFPYEVLINTGTGKSTFENIVWCK